jgi:hypothetical protein
LVVWQHLSVLYLFDAGYDLQLLGEMLLDRSNVKVMVKFVSEVPHLMQMMMLLKDQSRSIQFEAFHVFKVRGEKDTCGIILSAVNLPCSSQQIRP